MYNDELTFKAQYKYFVWIRIAMFVMIPVFIAVMIVGLFNMWWTMAQ